MTERHDRLEQLLERTLRDLPERLAPGRLEAKILAELQRRAAFPWWRRSFGYWPLAPRVGLVVACGAAIGLTLLDGPWRLVAPAARVAARLNEMVPSPWLNLTLGLVAVSYAALFGLGAAMYRTLYLRPSTGR